MNSNEFIHAKLESSLSARQNRILLNHFPLSVDGETFLPGFEENFAKETTGLFADFLGPS